MSSIGERGVLFVTHGLNLSGQSVHISNLAKGLQRLGWRTLVATGDLASGQPLGKEFFETRQVLPAEVSFRGWSPSVRWLRDQIRAAVELRHVVESQDPAVIHVHSATLAPLARYASHAGRTTRGVVTTLNNEQISAGKLRLARMAIRVTPRALGDRVVAISQEMEQLAVRGIGVRPDLVKRVDYGADEEYFRPPTAVERTKARSRFGLAATDQVICCVARLEPRKNQVVLIRALAALKARGRPTRLLLAGEDIRGYRAQLEGIATSLGVRDLVDFVAFVDPRDVYWASDVNALPSLQEGFGLAVIEAMLCKVPTIRSASTAGASDQIEHGRTGLLVNPKSTEGMAQAIDTAIGKRDLAENAASHVISRFTIPRLARQMSAIYHETIDGSLDPRPSEHRRTSSDRGKP